MKAVLLAVLVAVAAASVIDRSVLLKQHEKASREQKRVSSFDKLEYHYKTLAFSSLSRTESKISALKLEGVATVSTSDVSGGHYEMSLKVSSVKKMLNTVSSMPSRYSLPDESSYVSIDDKLIGEMTENLLKPIVFRMSYGSVWGVSADSSDPYWSVNIKKGVLSMLQMNLLGKSHGSDKTQYLTESSDSESSSSESTESSSTESSSTGSSDSSSSESVERSHVKEEKKIRQAMEEKISMKSKKSEKSHSRSSNDHFLIYEDGSEGNCEVAYTKVTSNSHLHSGSTERWVKTKNYRNCKSRPIWQQGLFSGIVSHHFSNPSLKNNLIESSSSSDYNVTNGRSTPIIVNGLSESSHHFTPFELYGGGNKIYTIQFLDLLSKDNVPVSRLQDYLQDSEERFTVEDSRETQEDSIERQYRRPQEMRYKHSVSDEERSIEGPFQSRNMRTNSYESQMRKGYKTCPEGLQMYIPNPITETPTHKKLTDRELRKTSNTIEDLLNKIVSTSTPTVSVETPMYISSLIEQLRGLSTDDLSSTIGKYFEDKSSDSLKKDVLLDILPSVGTPSVLSFITGSLIKGNLLSTIRTSYMMNMISLVGTPTTSTIRELLHLYKELPSTSTSDMVLKSSVILTAGTLTSRYMTQSSKINSWSGSGHSTSSKDISSIISEFVSLLHTSTSDTEKITILKSIGNAGSGKFLDVLEEFITSKNNSPLVRIQAMYSLRKLSTSSTSSTSSSSSTSEVRSIAMNRFLDLTESSKMRMAAFISLMDTKPSTFTMQKVATWINNEPNSQVTSFVVTYLKSISRSTDPMYKDMSTSARLVLPTINCDKLLPTSSSSGTGSSTSNHFSFSSDPLKLATSLDLYILSTPNSFTPEDASVRLNTLFFGKSFNFFEAGIHSHGTQTLLRRLFGPNSAASVFIDKIPSILNDPKELQNILQHLVNLPEEVSHSIDLSAEHIVKKVLHAVRSEDDQSNEESKETSRETLEEKIKFSERTLDSLWTGMYYKFFGNEMQFFSISESMFKELMMKVLFNCRVYSNSLLKGSTFNVIRTLAFHENSIIVPTSTGFPVHLNMTSVHVFRASGSVGVDSSVSLNDVWKSVVRGQLPKGSISIKFSVEPSVASTTIGHLSIDGYLTKIGSGMRLRSVGQLPATSTLTLDTSSMKLSMSLDLPRTSEKIMSIETKPFVYTTMSPFSVESTEFLEVSDKTSVSTHRISTTIGESFGTPITVSGSYSKREGVWSPYYPISGSNSIDVTFTPNSYTPESVIVELSTNPIQRRFERKSNKSWMWSSDKQESSEEQRDTRRMVEEHSSECSSPSIRREIRNPTSLTGYLSVHTVGGKSTQGISGCSRWSWSNTLMSHESYSSISITNSNGNSFKVTQSHSLNLEKLWPLQSRDTTKLGDYSVNWGDSSSSSSGDEMISAEVLLDNGNARWPEGLSPPSWAKIGSFRINGRYSPRLPLGLKETLYKVYEHSKSLLGSHASSTWNTNPSMKYKTPTGSFEVTGNVMPYLWRVDLTINSPVESLNITNLGFPMLSKYSSSKGVHQCQQTKYVSNDRDNRIWSRTCEVRPKQVLTFDSVSYPMMETQCEVLLSRDCSKQSLYSVYASRVPQYKDKKRVKIVVEKYVLELVPTSQDIEIMLNGVRSTLPLIVRSQDAIQTTILTVEREQGMLVVHAKKTGLIVQTDCTEIHTKVSPIYAASTCGLCGDYNGEIDQEFRGPDYKLYKKSEEFISSYLTSNKQCKREVEHPISGGVVCKETKIQMREELMDNEKHLCFSASPIPTCGRSCQPRTVVSKEALFRCIKARHPKAIELSKLYKAKTLSREDLQGVSKTESLFRQFVYGDVDTCVPSY